MTTRHPQNAPGDWYVDTRCIDCGASRTVAPGLVVEGGNQSVFARQPETADEITMAWRARLLCPTASVRTERHADVPHGVFPEEMTQDVYRLGYNAKSSYGAHAFAIRRSAGNAMVDAPRWTRAVVEQFEAWAEWPISFSLTATTLETPNAMRVISTRVSGFMRPTAMRRVSLTA